MAASKKKDAPGLPARAQFIGITESPYPLRDHTNGLWLEVNLPSSGWVAFATLAEFTALVKGEEAE